MTEKDLSRVDSQPLSEHRDLPRQPTGLFELERRLFDTRDGQFLAAAYALGEKALCDKLHEAEKRIRDLETSVRLSDIIERDIERKAGLRD